MFQLYRGTSPSPFKGSKALRETKPTVRCIQKGIGKQTVIYTVLIAKPLYYCVYLAKT